MHERHARQVGSNAADLGLVVGRMLVPVIELVMAAGLGSPEAYEEVRSLIGNVLRIYRSVEGLSVLDSRPAVKELVTALRRRRQGCSEAKI